MENMAKVTEILETEGNSEKALDTLMTGEKMLDKMLEDLLSPADLAKISHVRRKRSHHVGYYDPQYKWLAKASLLTPNHSLIHILY